MADDLLHPDDRPDPTARFRADLATYLRGLSGPELADLLDGLPDPVKVDLIGELAARGPAYARLPVTWPGHPDTEFMRRRSRARWSPTGAPPAPPAAPAHRPAPPWPTGPPTARCHPADRGRPAPAPATTTGKPTDHEDHELRLEY